MSAEEDIYVLPGDSIGFAEEYVPGRNVAEIGGKLIALVPGNVVKNDSKFLMFIEGSKKKLKFFNGDIVYGQITKNDQRQIIISIAGLQKGHEIVSCNVEGYIRLGGRRDDGPPLAVRTGDLIRGKVIRVGQNLELTIHGTNLGVLKTRCARCRNVMALVNSELYCENCQRTESRKIAPDYGNLKI